MALLPPSAPGASGAAVVYTAVSASDTYANNGREMLHVKNADGTNALTVTVTTIDPASQTNEGYLDRVFTVPLSSDRLLPVLPVAVYGSVVTVGFVKTGGLGTVTAAVIAPS